MKKIKQSTLFGYLSIFCIFLCIPILVFTNNKIDVCMFLSLSSILYSISLTFKLIEKGILKNE